MSPRSYTRCTRVTSSRSNVWRHGVHAAGPGRGGVGLREQGEGREPLGRADPRGDVEHEVLVGEVAAGRGVGQQQMLGDHERGEVARGPPHPHEVERLGGDARAGRHVAALARLADVVQQGPEQQAVAIGAVRQGARDERIVVVGRGEQAAHLDQRGREMGVDREAVVRVALGPASHVGPGGQEPSEQADAVERVEGGDAGFP